MLAGQIFLDGKSLSVLPLVTFYLSNGALIPLILLISEKKKLKRAIRKFFDGFGNIGQMLRWKM